MFEVDEIPAHDYVSPLDYRTGDVILAQGSDLVALFRVLLRSSGKTDLHCFGSRADALGYVPHVFGRSEYVLSSVDL